VLIIGCGFAGAATAFHLSQVFPGSILMIDRERVPGMHASGRNACLVRQSEADAAIRNAVASSQQQYLEHREAVGFQQCGSLLLGKTQDLELLREPDRINSCLHPPETVRQRITLLEGHRFDAALETPGDGVVDIWALLQHYIQGARARGVEVRLNREVQRISGDGPYRVETNREPLEASYLINAAGAWAGQVATMARATPLPLVSWKRHLFALEKIEGIQKDWPFVWSLDPEFYFRPESQGLLLSICDQERATVLEATVSPGVSERAAELVWQQLPALRAAVERDVWSCFRTKAPDGRFVIGWDPAQAHFFWVAALGGHGVGSSWEVGRRAAACFCNREQTPSDPFAPARLTATATAG
jgi:D-arginine dehydrogenase